MVELGVENFYIELVVECPVENAEQLRAIEGQYIREMGTLNIRIEGRTKQRYREDNKEKKKRIQQELVFRKSRQVDGKETGIYGKQSRL